MNSTSLPPTTHLTPQTEEAIAFLRKASPTGPWHLVSITDDDINAWTFAPEEEQELIAWIDAWQGRHNLYYHVNTPRSGLKHMKAKKEDIELANYLHVDIDGPAAVEILRASGLPFPTVAVSSGGGINALWRLREPCSDLPGVEQVNVAIARTVGGDHCQNVDRLLRLPGTINCLSEVKRKKGRLPALAVIMPELTNWDRTYSIEDLEAAAASLTAHHVVDVSAVVPVSLEQLPKSVLAATRILIKVGDDPDRPIGSEKGRYPSRSEVVYRVACDLARAECSGEMIAGVLINPEHGISASVLEKRHPAKYAARQAASALDAVSRDWPDQDKKGMPRATFRNVLLALRRLGLHGEYDEFHKRKILGGAILDGFDGDLSNDQCARLRHITMKEFGFDPGKENIRDAAQTLCLDNTYHPIREYLDRQRWDGTPRLSKWLSTYLGAEDTILNQAIARIMLVAAVRRVRSPGVKYDTIVVLEGAQGTGKSTALNLSYSPRPSVRGVGCERRA